MRHVIASDETRLARFNGGMYYSRRYSAVRRGGCDTVRGLWWLWERGEVDATREA
jgi:hypothetical protein